MGSAGFKSFTYQFYIFFFSPFERDFLLHLSLFSEALQFFQTTLNFGLFFLSAYTHSVSHIAHREFMPRKCLKDTQQPCMVQSLCSLLHSSDRRPWKLQESWTELQLPERKLRGCKEKSLATGVKDSKGELLINQEQKKT